MHGEKKGTALGFPTINIPLKNTLVSGIYAGTVAVRGVVYNSAVYVNPRRAILEAHLLDFSGDLYGIEVSITLLKKIRADKTYTNEKELVATISADIQTVRTYFESI